MSIKSRLSLSTGQTAKNARSPDAAASIWRTASGLAVDCWDWPGAIRILRSGRAALQSATNRQPHASGWPRSGLSHLTWSETYHALDHLLSGVARIVSTRRFQVKKKITGGFEGGTTNSAGLDDERLHIDKWELARAGVGDRITPTLPVVVPGAALSPRALWRADGSSL